MVILLVKALSSIIVLLIAPAHVFLAAVKMILLSSLHVKMILEGAFPTRRGANLVWRAFGGRVVDFIKFINIDNHWLMRITVCCWLVLVLQMLPFLLTARVFPLSRCLNYYFRLVIRVVDLLTSVGGNIVSFALPTVVAVFLFFIRIKSGLLKCNLVILLMIFRVLWSCILRLM